MRQITDMETWLLDNDGRVFRYLVYKRMFTPYEQQNAFLDESEFTDSHYSFGIIEEAVDLEGDWLLGIREVDETSLDGDVVKTWDSLQYYRLSELRLSCFDQDQPCFSREEAEE